MYVYVQKIVNLISLFSNFYYFSIHNIWKINLHSFIKQQIIINIFTNTLLNNSDAITLIPISTVSGDTASHTPLTTHTAGS